MMELRKIAVAGAVAVLFAVFVFSLINAFYERPSYDDFCNLEPRLKAPVRENCTDTNYSDSEARECLDQGYDWQPIYEGGCVVEYKCQTCNYEYNRAQEKYNFIVFFASSILGLFAVLASLYIPQKQNSVKEWIMWGFLVGGLAAIFIGTGQYFQDMHRILKPVIILAELLIVIFVAYKKIK